MNINNITATFASITLHQKEPLGCVVYSHCPTNDSYNKCIHSCCLLCNYVTKPFSILQRVIESQRVCISFGHTKKSIPFLSETFMAKCSNLFLNYQIWWKGNYLKNSDHTNAQSSRKKCSFFVYMRKCSHTSNCTWKFPHTSSDGTKQDTKNCFKNIEAIGWSCYS